MVQNLSHHHNLLIDHQIVEHRSALNSKKSEEDLENAFMTTFVDLPSWQDKLIVALIPAYNEDRFIASVVLKTKPFVDRVLVVDDGSSDETRTLARKAGAEAIAHSINRGKAEALNTGFVRARELKADVVVVLDADGQHNPQEIPVVIRPILSEQADMVIGSRFRSTKSRIPVWRQAGQHALTAVTNVASGVSSSDSQSGFRAFGPRALEKLYIHSTGFAVESEMQFWASEHNLRVSEVSISCVYEEKSKRNPISQGVQVLNGIISLVSQSRPLFFFGVAGLIVTIAGAAWWWWIVYIYDLTGQLALGYALMATLLVTIGTVTTFQGVTLHTLRSIVKRLPAPLVESRRKEVAVAAIETSKQSCLIASVDGKEGPNVPATV